MMHKTKQIFLTALVVAGLLGLFMTAMVDAQGQKRRATNSADTATPQALYSEYKGVRLGMTAEEARAKLGKPALKGADQDFFIFSDQESAQIIYDSGYRVVTISTDYLDGIGAPDYKAVVGDVELDQRQNGLYRVARYPSLGFWVSYNRTVGPMVIVTITLQKL